MKSLRLAMELARTQNKWRARSEPRKRVPGKFTFGEIDLSGGKCEVVELMARGRLLINGPTYAS